MSYDPNYPGDDSPEPRKRLRPLTFALSLIVAAAALGGLLSASFAEAGTGWFGGWRHGQCHGESGGHDCHAKRARDHAAFATGWVLRHLDASSEQEERIQSIVSTVIGEVSGLAESRRADHDAFMALLADVEIDRAKLEELRRQQIGMAESASRLLADAIADIAEVLTVEQRAELLEHARHHRDHGRRWH